MLRFDPSFTPDSTPALPQHFKITKTSDTTQLIGQLINSARR
jgi:hypothetical protein